MKFSARLRTEDDPAVPDPILERNDFLETIKPETLWWHPKKVTKRENGDFYAAVPKNEDFLQGVFMQVTHQMGVNEHTGLAMNFTQTSLMYHYPEEYPNEDCFGVECLGKLV